MTSADLLAMMKKQPVGFACGLVCVVCAALLYFRGGKIDENRAQNDQKTAEATKILDNVRNSEKLPAQVTEIQALTKELEGRLLRASQLAANLQYFYKLEAETEVKLLDVRQGNLPRPGKTLYMGIPFTVSVQGSFKQVMSFLQKLENGPHFCRFMTVNFGKSVSTGEASRATEATGITVSLNLELLGVP